MVVIGRCICIYHSIAAMLDVQNARISDSCKCKRLLLHTYAWARMFQETCHHCCLSGWMKTNISYIVTSAISYIANTRRARERGVCPATVCGNLNLGVVNFLEQFHLQGFIHTAQGWIQGGGARAHTPPPPMMMCVVLLLKLI